MCEGGVNGPWGSEGGITGRVDDGDTKQGRGGWSSL